jgi:hypothetical protein
MKLLAIATSKSSVYYWSVVLIRIISTVSIEIALGRRHCDPSTGRCIALAIRNGNEEILSWLLQHAAWCFWHSRSTGSVVVHHLGRGHSKKHNKKNSASSLNWLLHNRFKSRATELVFVKRWSTMPLPRMLAIP